MELGDAVTEGANVAIDIYTKQPMTTPSNEHLLPRALGGGLIGDSLTCAI